MKLTPQRKHSDGKELQRAIKKAEKRIRERMPGKTLEDVSEMYKQFHRELKTLRQAPGGPIEDILDCLDKYKDVLEIADMFPEQEKDSWEDYRNGLICLSHMQ